MQPSNGDPLDWTVDEVVNFLCHNPETPWSKSNSSIPRPNPVSFENSLRSNLITGEVLLQDVDKEALRDDLGLKALGHRSSVLLAIRFLQQRSPKLQASKSEVPLPLQSPLQPLPRPQHATIVYSSPVPTAGPNTPSLNSPTSTSIIPQPLNVGNEDVDEDNIAQTDPEANSHTIREFSDKQLNRSRPHEQIVVDKNGKKRRRLNLSSSVGSRNDNLTSDTSGHGKTKSWYMGPDVLTPGQVIYSSDPEGDDQTFTLISSKLPTAQRTFVNKRLRHFFQQSPIQLHPNSDSSQKAIVPYKPSMVASSNDMLFTLYTAKNGVISASKERINDWPQLGYGSKMDDQSQSESLKPSDPFSYLLKKYPVEDTLEDALPCYGDSGSEGEFDEDTLREIDEERSEPLPPQQKNLGPFEVDSIIRDCISEYENNWHESRLPKEEYKARKLWLAARKVNRVNQEIKAMEKDIIMLGIRLQKLQDEIRKNKYPTQAELRTQCQCLEHTIFNIQKEKWRISVLEQEKCPRKVPAPPKPQYPPKSKIADEESLYSESDFNGNDSLDDFVIDDTERFEPLQVENPPASPSSSDGDDDIISVSGTRRRTRGRAPRVFESSSPSASPSPSPSCPRPIREKPAVIDLTMETPEPEDLRIETPPLNPVGAAKSNVPDSNIPGMNTSISPPPSLGSAQSSIQVKAESVPRSSLPEIDDINGILSLHWELIEERRDRRRLLAKLLGGLADKERNNLAKHIPQYQFSLLKRQTKRAVKSLANGSVTVAGMEASENRLIMRTASFYVAWLNCVRLGLSGIPKKYVEKALKDLQPKESHGFGAYYEELIERLESSRETKAATSEADLEPGDTPHKKRKRDVKESQSAKINQASAQLRVAQQEKQRKKLEKKLEVMGLSNNNSTHQAVSFKDPVIYLNSHIGRRVKPHQLNGIRFMWRELIEDKNQQGCLLAHTMGLGKTMQVISLLTTISEAAASPNPKIRQQIPEAFRRFQTLILCPSSLIENWHDEFHMWSPRLSSTVRRVSSQENLEARLLELSRWHQEGGILLISYNIFQNWIINKETSKRGKTLSDAEHEMVRRWLLEGPNIIIADEAHKMKNPASATSMAAMQFRSKSRIALTGSPLANNLGDYHTMVNWIAEDYLGSPVEFKAHYIEPIEQGLYADSTYFEKRRSLMRLQVLKQILEPKINRADITVLEGDLPPKTEFLLTIPLTKLQKAVYDFYASFVLQGRMEDVAQTQLWSWLAILGLCSNHPACFWEKLVSRVQDAAETMSDGNQAIPGDESIETLGLPNLASLVSELNNILARVPDLKATELSARAEIATRIIDESIEAGDKVLLFSQSLPTLNYLEHVLKVSNRQYSRLDGQTPIGTRQAATKQFNQGAKKQVYLISTRAGGLGLNIPGANRVIIFDFSFSPIWEEQAIGRAYRLGQTKPVFVYRFIAGGTFEEIIHHKAIFKTQLSVRVVDKKNPVRFAQKKPGDYLFPAKPVVQQDVSGYIGRDKLVLDKILFEDEKKKTEDRLIRDIMLTQTFHTEDNDKLTEEEKRSVQEEFDDENLRRTDPAAYSRRIYDRQTKQMQQYHNALSSAPFPVSAARGLYQSSTAQNALQVNGGPPVSRPGIAMYQAQQQAFQPTVPQSAHNSGPPALVPDTISNQPPNSTSGLSTASPFLSQAQLASQTSRMEWADDQVQPNHSPKMDLSQNRAAPVETRIPAPQGVSRNTVPPPQASLNGVGSESPKTNCPDTNICRDKSVGERQESPSRGQSVPLQEPAPQVPEQAPESSLTIEQQQPASVGHLVPSGSDKNQPGPSCRQQ